jgi:putative copper export protein
MDAHPGGDHCCWRNHLHAAGIASGGRDASYVHLSIGFLLLSGFYTFINYLRGYQFPEGSKYHMLFGIKFLLALAIFFIASMLVGRSEASTRFRQRREFWLTLNVVLAVVLVCISGILRFLPRTPKTPAEPTPVTALLETNSLR